MKKSILCLSSILFAACANVPEGADLSDATNSQVEETAEAESAVTASVSASISITQDWGSGYCATVTVRNNSTTVTNSWSTRINLNGAALSGSPSNATSSVSGSTLTLGSVSYNQAIQPSSTISPASSSPSFCANGSARPSVISSTGTYCGTVYPDADGDGYGVSAGSYYTCGTTPTGYASRGGDCCANDARVFPGQTAYYPTTNACGTYDYNCDSALTKKSNGATGCFETPMQCQLNSTKTGCIAVPLSPLPAACNGKFTSYNQGNCGADWYISTKGCAFYVAGGTPGCTSYGNGGPGGTQSCR